MTDFITKLQNVKGKHLYTSHYVVFYYSDINIAKTDIKIIF